MKKIILIIIAVVALFAAPAFSQTNIGGSNGITGSGTSGFLPKFSASKKVVNSSLKEDTNGSFIFGTGSRTMSFVYKDGYSTLSFDEPTPSLTNYSLLKVSGTTIINGTDANAVSIRHNNNPIVNFNSSGSAIDLNNTISDLSIRLYDHYGIGLGSGKLLLNTNIGGSVQIGTYDGSTVVPAFEFSTVRHTINIPNLPTSSGGLVSGDLWNDGGILKVVP